MSLRLAQVAEVRLGRQRSPRYEQGDHPLPYLRSANVVDGSLDLTDVKSMNFDPVEQEIFALAEGDVLMTEGSGSPETVGTSAVWRAEIPGTVCFQNTLLRLRPRAGVTEGRFLAWWARHAHASGQIAAVSTGANIQHIGADGLKNLRINAPAVEEQRRIADFLDDHIARIDQIVAARRDQQAALETSLVRSSFDAITGGEAGPRRDSGLPWLGTIPASWPVLTVATDFQIDLGKMLDEKRQNGESTIPYLRNTNVQWDRVDIKDLKTMDIHPGERDRYCVRPGDLLICEGGQPGRSAVWWGDVTPLGFQKALHRARSRGRSRPEWLLECLRVAVHLNVFAIENGQTTIGHLTNEQLRSLRLPLPDRTTQDRTLEALHAQQAGGRAIITALGDSIALLNEFKQSLITASVTGGLDVTTTSDRGMPR